MLIEYRVEVKNGGVTITQRIDTDLVTPAIETHSTVGNVAGSNGVSIVDLPQSFGVQEARPAGKTQSGGAAHDSAGAGGGAHDPAGTGGGGSGSGLVIVFGPVIVCPSGSHSEGSHSGGGGHDDASTGGAPKAGTTKS